MNSNINATVHHVNVFVFYLVANSTPMVLLLSRLNSLRVNLESKLLLPTPESPINTTTPRHHHRSLNSHCSL